MRILAYIKGLMEAIEKMEAEAGIEEGMDVDRHAWIKDGKEG